MIILGVITTTCLIIQGNQKIENKSCEESTINIPIKLIDNENNKITYIYNGVEFKIELNYELIHDDGLHFCTEHNRFE